MNSWVQVVLLRKYFVVELLNDMGSTHWTSQDCWTNFGSGYSTWHSHQQCNNSKYFTASSILLLVTLYLTNYSSSCVVTFIAVLICIPQWLIILNIIYTMINYLCVFVCEICVKIFCPLKNLGSLLNTEKQEFFLYYGYKAHIRYMNWKYLLQGSLSFHLLNGVFQGTEVFNVEEVQFINFFHGSCFMWLKKSLYNPVSKGTFLCFLPKILQFSLNISVDDSIWISFCVCWDSRVKCNPHCPPTPNNTHIDNQLF